MAQKLYDLVVKTGEYTDGQGQVKGRYENIGSVMQGESGMFAIIKRTFNPAGVPNPENKDSLIASFFEQQNGQAQQPQQQGYQQQQVGYQPQQPQQPQQQYNYGNRR